ncbi:hypothetical protein LX32DRAFT_71124 [Colletotrichum zoysiae]|uniref:Uncharacterized protein n=1 Tax=Colletotrichum zoysiae TaxID=1216348 RepID=A0AAD9H9R7_9PEZI|nr:hypothetical protein LX32DRAFT_71124 [Colletotrichum zoysiae]
MAFTKVISNSRKSAYMVLCIPLRASHYTHPIVSRINSRRRQRGLYYSSGWVRRRNVIVAAATVAAATVAAATVAELVWRVTIALRSVPH